MEENYTSEETDSQKVYSKKVKGEVRRLIIWEMKNKRRSRKKIKQGVCK